MKSIRIIRIINMPTEEDYIAKNKIDKKEYLNILRSLIIWTIICVFGWWQLFKLFKYRNSETLSVYIAGLILVVLGGIIGIFVKCICGVVSKYWSDKKRLSEIDKYLLNDKYLFGDKETYLIDSYEPLYFFYLKKMLKESDKVSCKLVNKEEAALMFWYKGTRYITQLNAEYVAEEPDDITLIYYSEEIKEPYECIYDYRLHTIYYKSEKKKFKEAEVEVIVEV